MCCAGTVTWQLIALDCTAGPVRSHSQPFSLEPLQSKPLPLPHLTHLLQSLFNSSCSSSSSSSSSSPSSSSSSSSSAVRPGDPPLANAVVHVTAKISRTADAKGRISTRGEMETPGSEQPAVGMKEGTLSKQQREQVVNGLAVPNMKFARGLQHMPHPAVLDALAAVPRTSELLMLYSELKDKQVVSSPCICAGNFRLLSPFMSEFIVSSTAVALYVAIDTEIEGRFSDNNFLLLPWEPKVVAFLYDHSAVSTDELEHGMTFMSLTDTNVQL